MAPSGFKINRPEIARMMREIQREFDKHPISVPVQADTPTTFGTGPTVYNGPVVNVHGDHAQIAWGNRDVSQNQEHEQVIAPGYEAIAQALVSTLEHLDDARLSDDDRAMAEDAAKDALSEVTKDKPDRRLIRRAGAVVKGFSPLWLSVPRLAPVTASKSGPRRLWNRSPQLCPLRDRTPTLGGHVPCGA